MWEPAPRLRRCISRMSACCCLAYPRMPAMRLSRRGPPRRQRSWRLSLSTPRRASVGSAASATDHLGVAMWRFDLCQGGQLWVSSPTKICSRSRAGPSQCGPPRSGCARTSARARATPPTATAVAQAMPGRPLQRLRSPTPCAHVRGEGLSGAREAKSRGSVVQARAGHVGYAEGAWPSHECV